MKSAVLSLLMFGSAKAASWDYDHMEDWSHHFEMCGTNDQSPINIVPSEVLYDSSVCTPKLNWTIDWTVHDWKVKNNGHSLGVEAIEKLSASSGVAGDLADDYNNQYRSRTEPIARLQNHFRPEGSPIKEFCLHGFHFHWGLEDEEGSEHLYDGHQYPLEVHFVHYSCERDHVGEALAPYPGYANITAARDAGIDYHELAVVGIFFEVTEYDNPIFDSILSDEILEQIQFPGDWVVANRVYLQDIIPTDIFESGYYSYEGSLTTPPCTDIVRWHVSNSRSYIGKAQIARFRELMFTANKTQAPNFRDPQLNVNPVYACMDEETVAAKGRNSTATAVVWIWAVVVTVCMCCFMATCYYKSLRDQKKAQEQTQEPPKQKRQRLASKSSIDRRGTVGSVADGAHTTGHH